MAAPKAGGMLFRGRPLGGAETRRAYAGPYARLIRKRLARRTKQNPARCRAQPAFLSRCLRVRRAGEEISTQSGTAYRLMQARHHCMENDAVMPLSSTLPGDKDHVLERVNCLCASQRRLNPRSTAHGSFTSAQEFGLALCLVRHAGSRAWFSGRLGNAEFSCAPKSLCAV